jgi:hypothetical protein
MRVPSREKEKNPLVVKEIGQTQYKHFIDLPRRQPDQALEGTGSLLFDVENRKVYCQLSVRADPELLQDFIKAYNLVSKRPYSSVTWHSVDPQGNAVYHTNVVMAILKDHVVLCTESIRDQKEREHVVREITKDADHPRQVVDINY